MFKQGSNTWFKPYIEPGALRKVKLENNANEKRINFESKVVNGHGQRYKARAFYKNRSSKSSKNS